MSCKTLVSMAVAVAILMPVGSSVSAATDTASTLPDPPLERLGSFVVDGEAMPFSEAVRVGNMLYLSGKIGNVPGTRELAEGGIGPETRQTLENVRATLRKYGSSMDSVVSCAVYLADIAEWPAMNEVYRTFFTSGYPARSAMAASGLALGARVEVTCIAVVEDSQ